MENLICKSNKKSSSISFGYKNLGVVLKKAISDIGIDFFSDINYMEEYLNNENCDSIVTSQFILFIKSSNIEKYFSQIKDGLNMIDVNNIIQYTERNSGLNRNVVKNLIVAILYSLSLPTSLVTTYIPTVDGYHIKDSVIQSTEEYDKELDIISNCISQNDSNGLIDLLDNLNKMADNAHPYALFLKGLCYYKGICVEKNDKKALCFFELSAQNGYIPAYATLADYYFSCDIPDYTKSFNYYTMLGAIANSKKRQNRVKIILNENILNKKILFFNTILLFVIIVFDVFLCKGFLSIDNSKHLFSGILSILLCTSEYIFSIYYFIKHKYNNIKWSTTLMFILFSAFVLFTL